MKASDGLDEREAMVFHEKSFRTCPGCFRSTLSSLLFAPKSYHGTYVPMRGIWSDPANGP